MTDLRSSCSVVLLRQSIPLDSARITQRLTRPFMSSDRGASSVRLGDAGRTATQAVPVLALLLGWRHAFTPWRST
jgi:hypothetical protein